MERHFCKSTRKRPCRCLFKNPAIPASRACPVFFLDANSWQFLHLAQRAKSRAARGASGRFRNRRACKLACQRVWFESASTGHPGVALRSSVIRVHPRNPWFQIHIPVQASLRRELKTQHQLGLPKRSPAPSNLCISVPYVVQSFLPQNL